MGRLGSPGVGKLETQVQRRAQEGHLERARSEVRVSKLEPKGTREKVSWSRWQKRKSGWLEMVLAATQGDGHAGAGETEQG